jgi:hypothetical protein
VTNISHPIYAVYDAKRTACLNIKYYGRRLKSVERYNFWMDVFVAVSAPTSAVAGFWFFDTQMGHLVWQAMTLLATGLAVSKPFLKFSSKIKKFEQALSG